jgi:NAD(P)-dependent dehydrogenase (short-subunit alcohol dehydrogenase family)
VARVASPVVSWSIEDRNVIVTGGSSGIGRATATALAAAGANVTITSRDPSRASNAARAIAETTGGHVESLVLDLTDRTSIEDAAATYRHGHDDLAVLVNNAGTAFDTRRTTPDGVELTFATNHLGPFILTALLLPLLESGAPSRVIDVASSGHGWAKEGIRFDDPTHRDRYRIWEVYGHSKLANILHARELARRLGSRGIHAYAAHPGLVRTSIGRGGDSLLTATAYRLFGWRMLSPEEGADTIVWLATSPEPAEPNGAYFDGRQVGRSTRWARDDDQAQRLWNLSEQLAAAGAEEDAP